MPNLEEIKHKMLAGTATIDEIGTGILSDKFLLFNFLMDNNLNDVNHTLRISLGHRYLPFAPDRKKIEQVITTAINKQDHDTLNRIIKDFDFNKDAANYTTNKALLTKINFLKA